mgnify:FL=1
MLLAFDIGNTNIVLGVFKDKELITSWRIKTDAQKSTDEYGMIVSQLFEYEGLRMQDIDDIIISTVVPSVLFTIQHLSQRYFGINSIVVASGVKTGLKIKYDNPKQVGADRIVNAVAAYEKFGGPLIIIDFGTATTFCAISKHAEYLGGTIAPGVKISADSLFEKTSKLPKVELENPDHAICRNTIQSMQAGLLYSHMGMVEYVVDMMKRELAEYDPEAPEAKVIATGGLASMIEAGVDCIDTIERMLTLEGLQLIYDKNKNQYKNRKFTPNR